MICPQCGKEVDAYVGFSSETVKLASLDNGTFTNVIPTFTVSMTDGEARPQDFTNTVSTASANVGANTHYHTL